MTKPLAGKRAFEAMGRSARDRGLGISQGRASSLEWPQWARRAWAAGWIMQCPMRTTQEAGKAAEGDL